MTHLRKELVLGICLVAALGGVAGAAERRQPAESPVTDPATTEAALAPPYCGNDQCRSPETCSSCPVDCGSCYCGNGTCDPGETCACADCGPCPNSCVGRCGGTAPAGCSCSATCGYQGNCCPDVVQMCSGASGTPPFPDPLSYGAGTELFIDGPTAAAFASQVDPAPESDGFLLRRGQTMSPVQSTIPGFTFMHFDGTSVQNERASCSLTTNPDGMWTVTSGTDFEANEAVYSSCKASFLRVPSAMQSQVTVSGEYRVESHGAGDGKSLAMTGVTANNLAILTLQQVEQTTGAMCAATTNAGSWVLNSSVDNDSDAWCGARIVSWTTSTGIRRDDTGPVGGSWYVDACYKNPRVDDTTGCWNYYIGKEHEIDLGPKVGPTHTRACFLTRVESDLGNFNFSAASSQCSVSERADRIYLKAKATSYGAARCNARCIEYPNAQAWPPSPTLAGIGSSSPPAATDASVSGSQPGSGKLNLYVSPDGVYDKPLLYVPGFDPTNKGGALESMQTFGPLFRKLREALGFDIWILKVSGGASIKIAAREVARAIVQARNYGGAGRKVMVMSGSQGALDARIALATWEQGNRYQNPSDPEYVPGVSGVGPLPVSLWVSLNGPHEGAAGSVAIQLAVNEIAMRLQDAGVELPPEVTGMLASGPAAEMLNERLSPGCIALTEYCTIPIDIFRWFGNYTIRGSGSHFDLLFDPYLVEATNPPAPFPDTCVWLNEPHAGFYADVNSRGVSGNGWPQIPHTLAISNGSFSPQGCAHMPDPGRCTGPPVFTGAPFSYDGTIFSAIDFVHAGHAGICDRNTTVHFALEPGDLAGGDLRPGNIFNALDWGPIDEAPLHTLAGRDNFSLTFIPTESALSCPGAAGNASCGLVAGTTSGQRDHTSCDAFCRDANRAGQRFDNVLSNPTDRNDLHSSIHAQQALVVMAYLYEFGVADGDGLFGASNPFLSGGAPPPGEGLDCDDTIPEGAACDGPDGDACAEGTFRCAGSPQCGDTTATNPEYCNGLDDDCDGSIDDGLAGSMEWCDGADNNCDGFVDGACSLTTATCTNQSAILEFQASYSQALCLDEGLCSNARCASRCQQTDVVGACNGDNSTCAGGTRAKYTSGYLLQACWKDHPSMCRCECEANGSTYQAETVAPCTSCGNGICDGNDDCYNCPGDCYEVLDLPAHQCVLCDSTGETRCGPGISLWCCPPN